MFVFNFRLRGDGGVRTRDARFCSPLALTTHPRRPLKNAAQKFDENKKADSDYQNRLFVKYKTFWFAPSLKMPDSFLVRMPCQTVATTVRDHSAIHGGLARDDI
jgi:hypothetical protein